MLSLKGEKGMTKSMVKAMGLGLRWMWEHHSRGSSRYTGCGLEQKVVILDRRSAATKGQGKEGVRKNRMIWVRAHKTF